MDINGCFLNLGVRKTIAFPIKQSINAVQRLRTLPVFSAQGVDFWTCPPSSSPSRPGAKMKLRPQLQTWMFLGWTAEFGHKFLAVFPMAPRHYFFGWFSRPVESMDLGVSYFRQSHYAHAPFCSLGKEILLWISFGGIDGVQRDYQCSCAEPVTSLKLCVRFFVFVFDWFDFVLIWLFVYLLDFFVLYGFLFD